MTTIASSHPSDDANRPLVNGPMIFCIPVKCNSGSIANGSWTDCKMFIHSLSVPRMCGDAKAATSTVGTIAKLRVSSTRFHGAILICTRATIQTPKQATKHQQACARKQRRGGG